MRSGFVESRHRGHAVVMDVAGTVLRRLGSPENAVLPRSTNKPLQAVAMLDAGLRVDSELLAVMCGSHAGLPMQVAAVRRLLADAGLDEDHLANNPDLPLDAHATRMLLAAGGRADRLHQNCSGNHAGMLATCVAAGWPTSGYLDPEHPLQVAIRRCYERLGGAPVGRPGIDGCGAPLYPMSLAALAHAYLALVQGTGSRAVVTDAIRAHPDLLDGPGRPTTGLMAQLPGLIAKGGAEGMYVAALAGVGVVAIKIEDGAGRACVPVAVALLRELGVDVSGVGGWSSSPVFGGERVVGEVRAVVG